MNDYIGVFPAAGRATRLGLSGISKEVIPVRVGTESPRPVGQFLLQAWADADIQDAVIIGRPGKADLQSTLTACAPTRMTLQFCDAIYPWGTPFTLDAAYEKTQGRAVALGFPDIVLSPPDIFRQLRVAFETQPCDIMLALFPATAPARSDMVRLSDDGRVQALQIKPPETDLTQTWAAGLWQPVFSEFLHDYIARVTPHFQADPSHPEPYVGTVINAAIESGLRVKGISVRDGDMFDIGTPDALEIAQRGLFLDKFARS